MNPIPTRFLGTLLNSTTRRNLLVSGAAGLVVGCTIPPTITNLVSAVDLVLRGVPDAPFTPEYIENLPYATLTAKIGKGQRVLLVLSEFDGPDLKWQSANNATLVTRGGRLIKTAGLDYNLRETQGIEDDPISSRNLQFEGKFMRTVDIQAGGYGIPIESTFNIIGQEKIKILNNERITIKIDEINSARSIRWKFKNTFWLDTDTGFVWKAIQHFNPLSPPIEIQITKPANQ